MGNIKQGVVTMLIAQLMSVLFPASVAVDPDCNYYQNMNPGTTYYVYNNEYPGYYSSRRNCRWIGVAPTGWKVHLSCQVEIPQSAGCSMDRLVVATNGDPNLQNAHSYCGSGNFSIDSEDNQLVIGLTTASYTPGGRFLCTMQTLEAPPPATCDCGWKNIKRIVGGVETLVNEYPPMAGLVDFLLRDVYCGATIIATRYAVTAAHCLLNKQPTAVGLLVGDHNTTSGAETSGAKLLVISQFIRHPLYDPNDPKARNDIGIVVTQKLIEFNMLVGPACLPFRFPQESFQDKTAELLGWGTTEFTGPKSDVLLKTDVNVLSPQVCQQRTGATADQMCTYKVGHDACQSDSGGPVLWQDPSTLREQLIGIISTGIGCASTTPAINTRVTSYLTWILSVTPGVDYCVK